MFKSRGRKIFRDIWSRKGRTAMASLAIFFGVLGVVILVSVGDLMVSQLKKDLLEDELAMQVIFVTLPSGAEPDNAAALESLRALPGVANVEGRAVAPLPCGRIDWGEGKDDCFILAAWEPFDEMALQPMRLTKGRFPVSGQYEIAIEKRMAKAFELDVGDELVLRTRGASGGYDENWTIVGIVYQPYATFTSDFDLPDNDKSIFATYEDAQSIAGFAGFGTFYVRYIDYATAEARARDLVGAVAQSTPYIPIVDFVEDPSENSFITITQEITGILTMLAMVALVVSGFLVISVINTIVVEQKRQIGVMKSLGATRWDNFVMYAGIALTYGMIGTVPGVILGIPLGFNMASALAEMPNSLIDEFAISSQGVIMGAVMGLLVPLLAAAIPVFVGTRVSILDAMTDLGIATDYGRSRLSRLIGVLPIPITVRQAFSNVTRKKGRLFLTWFTLMLAVGSFMGVFSVFSSLGEQISAIFDAYGFHFAIVPNETQDFDQLRSFILENEPEIQALYPAINVSVELEGYFDPQRESSTLFATGFDPGTDTFAFNYEAGRGWQDDPNRDGVVLSSSLAKALGKAVGDKVLYTAGGQNAESEIIGIVSFASDAIFVHWQVLARLGGFVDAQGEPVAAALLAKLKNGDPSVDEVEVVMDRIAELLLAEGIPASLSSQVEDSEEAADDVMIFGMVFGMTAAVMAAVGAIGLLAALSMAVFERQKEIGVMRSIGAGSLTISGQFLIEGILVGLAAWIVGVPLGYGFSKALVEMLPFFGIEIPFAPISLVVGLIGIVTVATISSLWPSISAARKTVSEIIRYQ
jgi:putative ABC transport system permease protein